MLSLACVAVILILIVIGWLQSRRTPVAREAEAA